MQGKLITYSFSLEKNKQLKLERNISFEEIIAALENDKLLDVVEHHNKGRYSNQQMYVVEMNDYVYLVPFIKDSNGNIFLKTIFPSRKANRRYRKEGNKND